MARAQRVVAGYKDKPTRFVGQELGQLGRRLWKTDYVQSFTTHATLSHDGLEGEAGTFLICTSGWLRLRRRQASSSMREQPLSTGVFRMPSTDDRYDAIVLGACQAGGPLSRAARGGSRRIRSGDRSGCAARPVSRRAGTKRRADIETSPGLVPGRGRRVRSRSALYCRAARARPASGGEAVVTP